MLVYKKDIGVLYHIFALFLICILEIFLEIEVNLMIIAVVVYDNADTQKESIIKDNRGKVGIYR